MRFHFSADRAIHDVGINARKAVFNLLAKKDRTSFEKLTVNVSIKDFPGASKDQSLESQSVGSLGLALTIAIFYNYQIYRCADKTKQEMRRQIQSRLSGMAFTGAVGKDGKIESVRGVKEKVRAALKVHMDKVFIPYKDKKGLKGSIPYDSLKRNIRSEKRAGKVINAINNQLYFYPRLLASLSVTVITIFLISNLSFLQFIRDFNLIFHKAFYELREFNNINPLNFITAGEPLKKRNSRIILVLTNEAIYDKKKEKEADIEIRSKIIDFLTILDEPEYKPEIIGIDFFFQNRYTYEQPYLDVDFKLAYKISQMGNKVIIPLRISREGVKEFPYREIMEAAGHSSGYTNIPHSDDFYDGLRVDLWRDDKEKNRYYSLTMKMLMNLFKTNNADMEIADTFSLREAWGKETPFSLYLSNKYLRLSVAPEKNIFIPMDEDDTVHINYTLPILKGGDWEYYHLDDVIRSYNILKSGETGYKTQCASIPF